MYDNKERSKETVLIVLFFRVSVLIFEIIMTTLCILFFIPMLLFGNVRRTYVDHFMVESSDYKTKSKRK